MNYKELFDKIKRITTGQVLIKGFGTIVKDEDGKFVFDEFSCDNIYESTGNFDEDLMRERFDSDHNFEVECDGEYRFEALFSYSEAQIGDYPPPNVEVPAYYDLLHIEFHLEISKDELEKISNEDVDTNTGWLYF